jgi:Domain of unknown function (DUF4157)
VIQPKLAVGEINDPLEHDADSIADQVMAMPDADFSIAAVRPQVSRKCAACEEEENTLQTKRLGTPEAAANEAPGLVHKVLLAPGQPLDAVTRAFFEPRFGHDFSHVRIHTDTQAADSAAAVRARAYALGNHIVFGRNMLPETSSGLRLLAHELVHVTQQQAFTGQSIGSNAIGMGVPGDAFESEADARAEAAVSVPAIQLATPQARPSVPQLSGAWESCGDPVDCPKREPGEAARNTTPTWSIGELVTPDSGEIVSGFAIGSSAISGLQKDPTWSAFVASVGSSSDHWEILGFSDCEGGIELNSALREKRAQAVLALLPGGAKAKVDRAAGAPLSDCIAGNESESNRAFNRAVVFRRTSQTITIPADVIKGVTCPPASGTAVTDLADYIALLRCAETTMGLGPREMLAVFRQIYYGKSWSVKTTSKWDNVITCSPAVGDPLPKLGANLFSALKASQEVAGVDVGHVFAGLEAMTCPTPDVLFYKMASVSMPNEEFATWGGDLGAAAAAHVGCPQLGASAATNDDCGKTAGAQPFAFYRDVSAPLQDLEGDIEPFIARANQLGIACSGSSQKSFLPTKPMSEIFADTYLDPTSALGKAYANRYRCMLEILGATFSGNTVSNRKTIAPLIAARVFSFAQAFYIGAIVNLPSNRIDDLRMQIDSEAGTDWFISYLESKL